MSETLDRVELEGPEAFSAPSWDVVGVGPVAAAVRQILEAEPDHLVAVMISVAATASAATAALAEVRPEGDRRPLILVTESLGPGELRAALAAEIVGIVLASEVEFALLPCLGAVRVGQLCVPHSQARQVDPAALSTREKQILGLVVMGYMNGEIAAQLFIAESTVKSHLSSAFAKLGVKSRNEAVDLIVDSQRGLGIGILGIGGETIESRGGEPT
ncbi:MAG TPA: LuxR C-terminal-related transcriptional regulator [Solirubrobacterales bacterium]